MNWSKCLVVVAWSCSCLSLPLIADAQSGGDKRLLLKTSVAFDAKPVEEVLLELGKKHKITVEFDPTVKANAAGEMPFTLTANGLTLGSVIDLACRSADLLYTIEKGKLLVFTREADQAKLIDQQYSLAPLGAIPDVQVFLAGLQQVTSGPWKDADGDGGEFVEVTPQSLTVRQTRTAHAELQALFEDLAAAAAGRAKPPTIQERAEQTIRKKLQTPTLLAAGEMPVSEVLDQLLKKNAIPYWIDSQALSDEGIDWAKATTMIDGKKMPTAARLDAITAALKLAWRVDDEVVQITTQTKANEHLTTRVYDISRSVTPNRSPQAFAAELTNNKELGPWQELDGAGGVVVAFGPLLAVRQTDAVHAKLDKLLK
jgi:hypothetical protein